MTIFCLSVLLFFILFLFVFNQSKINTPVLEEQDIIVGFSQIGAESAWRTFNTLSILDAAEKNGIKLIYANAEQKQENQIKAIRSFIVYQVDIIVFVPIVKHGWDNVLKEAQEAGIPVIIIDRQITTKDESLYTAYVGNDSFEEGELAAKFLFQKFEDINKPIRIFELRGTEGSSAAEGRYNGFRNVLLNDSRFKIVHSESGDFLKSRGKEIVKHFLEKFDLSSIDVIFSHNDGMTLGAIEAFQEAGIEITPELTIVSVDAEQAAINALQKGLINCVVECNPDMGDIVMDIVKKIHGGISVPKKTSTSNQILFTEFDDLTNLATRGY